MEYRTGDFRWRRKEQEKQARESLLVRNGSEGGREVARRPVRALVGQDGTGG